LISLLAKKLLHELFAFFFKNARSDFYFMIQRTVIANAKNCFDRAESFIRRAVNKAFNPRVDERARAHSARFYRRIKARFSQTIVANFPRRLAQNQNFGVRRRVRFGYRAVSGYAQKLARFVNQTRADWNFVQIPRARGGFQSASHPKFIRLQRHKMFSKRAARQTENIVFPPNKVKRAAVWQWQR
jgi:hypothetical protein